MVIDEAEVVVSASLLEKSFDKVKQKFDSIKNKLQSGANINLSTKFTSKDLTKTQKEFQKIQDEIAKTEQKLASLDSAMDNIRKSTVEQFALPGIPTDFADTKVDEALGKDNKFQKLLQQSNELHDNLDKLKSKSGETAVAIEQIGKNNGITQLKTKVREATGSIHTGFSKGIKTVFKYGLALMGIRSIYGLLSGSLNSYLGQNEQLKANIEYIKFAIGNALGPVIERVAGFFLQTLSYVGAIIKILTGVNIFAGSYSKHMASASKSAQATAKAMHSTGIDELNVINNSDNSSSDSGVGSPSMDLEGMVDTLAVNEKAKGIANTFAWLWENLRLGAGMCWVGMQAAFFGLIGAWEGIIKGFQVAFEGWITGIKQIFFGGVTFIWGVLNVFAAPFKFVFETIGAIWGRSNK